MTQRMISAVVQSCPHAILRRHFNHLSHLMRLLLFCSLIGLLAACGAGATGDPGSTHATSGSTSVSTSKNSSLATASFNGTANATIAGLQIHTEGVVCGAFLLLNDPHANYSQQSIEAISSYVAGVRVGSDPTGVGVVAAYLGVGFGATRGGQRYYAIPFSPTTTGVPSSLRWVPGGESCFGQLEVTNVTANALVIASIGATLTRDAASNTTNYQLLDVCTLPGHSCPPPGGAEPGCLYFATIGLSGGRIGDHVEAPLKIPQNGVVYDPGTCLTPLTLGSHQSQEIDLIFASNPQHLIYNVNLTITINGSRHSLPTAFVQSLVFIDATSKISCFAYQDGRFVVQQPIKTDDTNYWTRDCM